jgi:hypothetical protein
VFRLSPWLHAWELTASSLLRRLHLESDLVYAVRIYVLN